MVNPWVLLAGVIAIALALGYGDYHGRKVERTAWQAKIEQARAEAAETALRSEREQQKGVNDAIQQQAEELAVINSGLRDDIKRLQSRPPRIIRVPGTPTTDCEGTTGRELSRPDAEFLTGLAARADTIRSALIACYAYADSIGGGTDAR